MAGAEKRRVAGVNDHRVARGGGLQLGLGQRAQFRQRSQWQRTREIGLHIVRKIGGAIRQVFHHPAREFVAVFDLQRPVAQPFLAEGRKRRRGDFSPAQRAAAMRGIDLQVVGQRQQFPE